jgi:Uma2 family endonuclease
MAGMTAQVDPATEPDFRGLTRAEYDELVALGTFDDEAVELLDGGIYRMSPQGWPHQNLTDRLRRHLERSWWRDGDERFLVSTHAPVVSGDTSEPEPDLYVYDAAADRAGRRPDFAHLVVEVAQSSQGRDLVRKPAIYASSGFPEYWVIDLPRREVVVHRNPLPDLAQYASVQRLPFETELTVLGVAVRLTDLTD